MTRRYQIKILNDKIKANNAQYKIDRLNAVISAFSDGNLDKYEFLTCKDLGYKPNPLQVAKFEYSPLGKIVNEGLSKDDEKAGVLQRLKNIEDGLKRLSRNGNNDRNDNNGDNDNKNDDNDNNDDSNYDYDDYYDYYNYYDESNDRDDRDDFEKIARLRLLYRTYQDGFQYISNKTKQLKQRPEQLKKERLKQQSKTYKVRLAEKNVQLLGLYKDFKENKKLLEKAVEQKQKFASTLNENNEQIQEDKKEIQRPNN